MTSGYIASALGRPQAPSVRFRDSGGAPHDGRAEAAATSAPGPASGRERHRVAIDRKPPFGGIDMGGRALAHAAFQDAQRQRILQLALDHPLQGPRPVDRVVAGIAEPGLAPRP